MPDSVELGNAYGPHLHFEWDGPSDIADRLDKQSKQLNKKVARKVQEGTPIFDQLAAEIHPVNVEKGFWGEPEFMDKVAGKLALVHSEVSEILEALRKSQGAGKVTEEFADVFIRCLDLHSVLVERKLASPNLTKAVRDKMEKNKTRPAKHGHIWG